MLSDQNEAQKTKVPKTTVFNRYSGPLNGARREVRSEATRRLGLGVIELNSPRATPELHSSKDNSSQGITLLALALCRHSHWVDAAAGRPV